MWIFQIARFFRNFFRLIAIFFIILKHIVKNWMYNTWMRRIFDPKGKRLTSRAEQLRQTIEELGPTFVKFGQIVADRPDLASDHLREELKKLQSNARPMDDGESISLIETELGDPIEEVFFDAGEKAYCLCFDRTSIFRSFKNWRTGRCKNSTSQYQT